jgi:hypothetical protein
VEKVIVKIYGDLGEKTSRGSTVAMLDVSFLSNKSYKSALDIRAVGFLRITKLLVS